MSEPGPSGQIASLEDAIRDERFPDVDLSLRAGVHIDGADFARSSYLDEAGPWLRDFYDAFGCELIRSDDRFWYLAPRGAVLGSRRLSRGEMVVGSTLALLFLDPASTREAGQISVAQLQETLGQLIEERSLARVLLKRGMRAPTAETRLREVLDTGVRSALRRLKQLGFIGMSGDTIALGPALLRFVEPVRSAAGDDDDALQRLIARGWTELEPAEAEAEGEADDGDDTDEEPSDAP